MGISYGAMFAVIGLLLIHPTIGLANSKADPSRLLGWTSYCLIESFGSMVVQCYWALVNSSVDVHFAKKNFGLVVAGAQIGSILGPTLATQASTIGIPALYMTGAVIMFLMVGAMYYYVSHFVDTDSEAAELLAQAESAKLEAQSKKSNSSTDASAKKKETGVMEGFYLFYEHDYVKGIFAVSSLYMVQVSS